MQDYNWNDLRYVLALHRAGTLTRAGRAVGADETTVARRLRALERALHSPLFMSNGTGRYEATEIGLKVIGRAERIEHEFDSINDTVGTFRNKLLGVVRITTVPIIVHRVLIPNLSRFRDDNPGVTLELIPDARNLSLSKREADLALRFARPEKGGFRIKAQKLGALTFAVYGPASIPAAKATNLKWIEYDDAHYHLPQARWLADVADQEGSTCPHLRVSDAETALEAVAAGLGKTILPVHAANTDLRLRRLQTPKPHNLPTRDVWLLSHAHHEKRQPIAAARQWLKGLTW
ncbi:MAG: LysR family transcriptional regulator [Hyphomicrobiaceae bacterium]